MAAFLDGRPLAFDVVADRELYASVHPRLIGGYVLDALRAQGVAPGPGGVEPDVPEPGADRLGPDAAERFLSLVRYARRTAVARPYGGSWIVTDPPLPPPSRRRG